MPDTIAAAEPITLAYPVGNLRPRLLVHSRAETVSNFIREHHVWQRPITAFIVSYLRPGDVFVDVGANIGYFTVLAALQVGESGKVHAVEPDVDNAALLRANIDLNDLVNVQVHQLAVSDIPGEASLFRGDYNSGAHSLLPKGDLTEGPKVKVCPLDTLLDGQQPPKLIKIDVQGGELLVLQSMKHLLAKSPMKPAVIVEFSPLDLASHGHINEFFAFIAAHRYSLRAFIANERHSLTPPQIRRATLRQIAEDLLHANDPAEFDLLLLPHK